MRETWNTPLCFRDQCDHACRDANTYACNTYALVTFLFNACARVRALRRICQCHVSVQFLRDHNQKIQTSFSILSHQKSPLGRVLLVDEIERKPLLSTYTKTQVILKLASRVLSGLPGGTHRCAKHKNITNQCLPPGNPMANIVHRHRVTRR